MRWLRADEAAVWLRVSVSTVYVIAHRDQWERKREGRDTVYALDDVQATKVARLDKMEARKTPATAPTAPGRDRP